MKDNDKDKDKDINETPVAEEEKVEQQQDEGKGDTAEDEMEAVKKALEEKSKECEEHIDQLKRLAAEFDNYRKRTAREKEGTYNDAVADTVAGLLPVLDNLERAINAECSDPSSLKEGVELVLKQFRTALSNLGVEEIAAVGETFDPQLHNAVMHEESEDEKRQNIVVEEFQKGYKIKERVIRHSMVKVLN